VTARRLTTAGLTLAILLGAGPYAAAQIDIGGNVDSMIGLSLTEPDGFATFPASRRARTHELQIDARVTSTLEAAQLSVADAETGGRRGRLPGLGQPLQVTAGRSAFRSLDTSADPLLEAFDEPLANEAVAVRVRQRVLAGARRGPFRKRLLITASSETP
jgi:hypothetical protein